MFPGALVMAFWMNAELAAVILVGDSASDGGDRLILRTAYPRFTAMQKALDTLNSGIQEVLDERAGGETLCGKTTRKSGLPTRTGSLGEAGLRALEDRNCDDAGHDVRDECDDYWQLSGLAETRIIGGRMAVGDPTAFTTYIVQDSDVTWRCSQWYFAEFPRDGVHPANR